MTRMTRPDCAVMCNLINIHTYMAIDVVVNVQHNGGCLPDIILLTQCYYHRETQLNAMKRFCLGSLVYVPT